jgi:hypothetical protein
MPCRRIFCAGARKNKKNLKWKNGGSFSIMGGQTGSRNWTAAPEKFLSPGLPP